MNEIVANEENEYKPMDLETLAEGSEASQKALQESYDKMPRVIFKCKSLSSEEDLTRTCDILKNHRIYMPTYNQLNDPFEGASSVLYNVTEKMREAERLKWQILSFSTEFLLPTMWAYYAGNYNGVCIGFKTHESFDDIKEVEYVKGQMYFSVDLQLSTQGDLTLKHECWKEEKEWRLLRYKPSAGQTEDEKNYFSFKDDDILCVFIGYKVSKENREIIKQALPQGAKLYTVYPDNEKFCLYARNEDSGNYVYDTEQLIKDLDIPETPRKYY